MYFNICNLELESPILTKTRHHLTFSDWCLLLLLPSFYQTAITRILFVRLESNVSRAYWIQACPCYRPSSDAGTTTPELSSGASIRCEFTTAFLTSLSDYFLFLVAMGNLLVLGVISISHLFIFKLGLLNPLPGIKPRTFLRRDGQPTIVPATNKETDHCLVLLQ